MKIYCSFLKIRDICVNFFIEKRVNSRSICVLYNFVNINYSNFYFSKK